MIAFEAQISDAIKEAMKAKAQVRLDCLRAMKSALKYKSVEKSQADVSEEEAIAVFQSMIKQRKDSFDQFTQFGRADAAEKERLEIEVISSFLPTPLTSEELAVLVRESIAAVAATSLQDLGKVMKEIRPRTLGRADGKLVSELVKQALS